VLGGMVCSQQQHEETASDNSKPHPVSHLYHHFQLRA
jgi:hypothetical protein